VQIEVRKFEPRNAVFAGPTGLEVIERLIPQAREALPPGGMAGIRNQRYDCRSSAALALDWNQVEFRNDLQGIARVAVARRNPRRASGEPGAPPGILERHAHTELRGERNSHLGRAEEISQRALGISSCFRLVRSTQFGLQTPLTAPFMSKSPESG